MGIIETGDKNIDHVANRLIGHSIHGNMTGSDALKYAKILVNDCHITDDLSGLELDELLLFISNVYDDGYEFGFNSYDHITKLELLGMIAHND